MPLVRVSRNQSTEVVEVGENDTVMALKHIIYRNTSLHVEIYRQTLKINGRIMRDNKLVSDYENVFHEDHVIQVIKSLEVVIIFGEDTYVINVPVPDRVRNIKETIRAVIGVPIWRQELYYGENGRLRFDQGRLDVLGIRDNDRMVLRVRYPVTVTADEESHQIFIHGSWRMGELKQEINMIYGYDVSEDMEINGHRMADHLLIMESPLSGSQDMLVTYFN